MLGRDLTLPIIIIIVVGVVAAFARSLYLGRALVPRIGNLHQRIAVFWFEFLGQFSALFSISSVLVALCIARTLVIYVLEDRTLC
jgi:hypothetical protein